MRLCAGAQGHRAQSPLSSGYRRSCHRSRSRGTVEHGLAVTARRASALSDAACHAASATAEAQTLIRRYLDGELSIEMTLMYSLKSRPDVDALRESLRRIQEQSGRSGDRAE